MSQSGFHGRFLWQELLTRDVEAATRFYTKLLPWSARPFAPGAVYHLFVDAGGAPQAGMVHLPEDKRGNGIDYRWQVHIGANDVDATVARATALGARVVMPAQDMPNVGRVAVLADPQGNHFGVYRPVNADSASPEQKAFAWNELATTDREQALAFYRELFGWELRPPMDMGGGMTYQVFGLGKQDLGGGFTVPPGQPMPRGWLPYASHRSADEAAGTAVAAGGKVCMGPMTVPGGGRIVQIMDPLGVTVAIHSAPAAMAMPAPAAKAKAKVQAKAKAKPKVKAKPKAKPKAVVKPKAKVKAKVKAKAKPKSRARVKAKSRAKVAVRRAKRSAPKRKPKPARRKK
jgi:predicted enzyme related to lactoylglutathione lyase